MMTASGIAVSGILAEGLPVDAFTRRIAAESVSPQLVAVLGTDTELRFAEIPVMLNTFNEKFSCKGIKNPPTGNEIFYVFLQKNIEQSLPLSVFYNPTNTYLEKLQEKRDCHGLS